ncbi:MAG TPA: TauD/TfdA family dioxygenase, partial [Caulobacter sp.]|nr:TauD/TfdA family dioxygenase [Caulobacter sp.]
MNQLVRSLVIEDLTIVPLTPTIGAEVEGIDLARPLDDATVKALRQALLDWKVLFFRDQDITTEQ